MTERFETDRPKTGAAMDELFHGISEQVLFTPDNDPSIKNLMAALSVTLPDSPLQRPLGFFAEARSNRLLEDNVGMIRTIFTVDALMALNPRQPSTPIDINSLKLPENTEEWVETIQQLEQAYIEESSVPDGHRRVEQFLLNLGKENQASNESRYTPAAWVATAYSRRWPEGVKVLDIGAATKQGVNSLAHHKNYSLHRAEVITQGGEEHRKRTLWYNRMLSQYFRFHSGVAVDAIDISTEDDKLWPIGALRHTAELSNHAFMVRYLRNANSNPRNVRFERCDFSSQSDTEAFLLDEKRQESHMAIMSMMLYQNNPDDRKKIIAAAQAATARDGILVVQDRLRITGNGLYDIEFAGNWFGGVDTESGDSEEGEWAVAIYDNVYPEEGWQIAFTSPSSRFKHIAPAPGLLKLGGKTTLSSQQILDDQGSWLRHGLGIH